MLDVNLFRLGVLILIISQTGFGYTNNRYRMGESTYQEVCESRSKHFENDNEMEARFRHSTYSPMLKHQSTLSRYHSGTENSRIYKERDSSKDEHSNYFHINQHESRNRSQRRFNIRRNKESHNRLSEQVKARDLSRQWVDISSLRNANAMRESAFRPRYTRDILTISTRINRDLPLNGLREVRASRYNYELKNSQNAAYHARPSDSAVEQRESRYLRKDHINNNNRRMETRHEGRLPGNKRPGENRGSRFVDYDRDQTRKTKFHPRENFDHSLQSRDRTLADSRREESLHVESRYEMPVENDLRVETRAREMERPDRMHLHFRARHMESPEHRLERNRIRASEINERHAERRARIETRSIESREQKLERRKKMLVEDAPRRETYENRLESHDRMTGDNSRRVVTRNRNFNNRDLVSAYDNGRTVTRQRRVETRNQMRRDNNDNRVQTRNLPLHDDHRGRQLNRMSDRRVERYYDRMPENNGAFHKESHDNYNTKRDRRFTVDTNRAGSRDNDLADDGRLDPERRSIIDIVRNVDSLDGNERRTERSGRMLDDHGHRMRGHSSGRNNRRSSVNSLEIQRSENTINLHRQRERPPTVDKKRERKSNNYDKSRAHASPAAVRHSVIKPSTRDGSFLKVTNLIEEQRTSDFYREQSRRETRGKYDVSSGTKINHKQSELIDDKLVGDASHYNITLLNTIKTILFGLLVIQLIHFGRDKKRCEGSFLGRFTFSQLLSNKVD